MSTGVVIAIVVVAILILATFAVLIPRARQRRLARVRERQLAARRREAAESHRQEAEQHTQRAELAERRARISEQEAQREHAEANLRRERAELHERGLADDELADDSELGASARGTEPATVDQPATTASNRDTERDPREHELVAEDERRRAG